MRAAQLDTSSGYGFIWFEKSRAGRVISAVCSTSSILSEDPMDQWVPPEREEQEKTISESLANQQLCAPFGLNGPVFKPHLTSEDQRASRGLNSNSTQTCRDSSSEQWNSDHWFQLLVLWLI